MLAAGSSGTSPELASPGLIDRVEHIIKENARAAVNMALLELADKPGIGVTTEIVIGSPARCIVDEAERWGADLIVVGSCGDRYWHSLFRGSASLAVARYAKCTVEIVKFVRSSKVERHSEEVAEKEVSHAISYSF
jgi:nucleotide-binding universal stress UspA family protein